MANQFEKLEYQPIFKNIEQVIAHIKKMTPEQALMEITHLKYKMGQATMDLMLSIKDCEPKIKKLLIELISIVALTDIPNLENDNLLRKKRQQEVQKYLNLAIAYKKKLLH